MHSKAQLCLALDVDELDQVSRLVDDLKDVVDVFKVGLQLYCQHGNKVIERIKKSGGKIFLDLKFFDIPNTVANACRVSTSLGVDILNLHSIGGMEMMKAAVNAVNDEAIKTHTPKPHLIAVTILTSINDSILNKEIRVDHSVEDQVVHLARLAQASGLDGVVASPLETRTIRKACSDNFLIVTPGIRPSSASEDDQKRILTPSQAISAGSDILVVGRPIYSAKNPRAAAEQIKREMVQ